MDQGSIFLTGSPGAHCPSLFGSLSFLPFPHFSLVTPQTTQDGRLPLFCLLHLGQQHKPLGASFSALSETSFVFSLTCLPGILSVLASPWSGHLQALHLTACAELRLKWSLKIVCLMASALHSVLGWKAANLTQHKSLSLANWARLQRGLERAGRRLSFLDRGCQSPSLSRRDFSLFKGAGPTRVLWS